MSDRENLSQPVSSGCTRLTLEEMIQSSTLSFAKILVFFSLAQHYLQILMS
jgi:hypothetical protein